MTRKDCRKQKFVRVKAEKNRKILWLEKQLQEEDNGHTKTNVDNQKTTKVGKCTNTTTPFKRKEEQKPRAKAVENQKRRVDARTW